MKDLFPGHYRPEDVVLTNLLREGLIILDTNVILNLYRYPQSAREDLLKLLNAIKDRLWIPHQVAHEYQRNRVNVISEQIKKFSQARHIADNISKTVSTEINSTQILGRHSLIDPASLRTEINGALQKFTTNLNELEQKQMAVNGTDDIRDALDILFQGRIGPPPFNQAWLDSIFYAGKERYKHKLSPGWADSPDKEKLESYSLFELRFEPMFGDLVIWAQILEKIEVDRPSGVIVVTDDTKPDWWHTVDSQGKKILGPNPHLVEEVETVAPGTLFYMYNSERFVKYGNEALSVPINDNSLSQIRAAQKSSAALPANTDVIHNAVQAWLIQELDSTVHQQHDFPDFIAGTGETGDQGRIIGIELKSFRSGTRKLFTERLRMANVMAGDSIHHGLLDEFHLVIVASKSDLDFLFEELPEIITNLSHVSTITLGSVLFDDSRFDYAFNPVAKYIGEAYSSYNSW